MNESNVDRIVTVLEEILEKLTKIEATVTYDPHVVLRGGK